MMKRPSKMFVVLALLAALPACSDDPAGPGDGFVYPLQLGNKWEYAREFSSFNFRPDTTAVAIADTTILSTVSIEITRTEKLPGSITASVLYEKLVEGDRVVQESESFYANQEDGLYFYRYKGAGHVIPKRSADRRIYFKGRYFRSAREVVSFLEKTVAGSDSMIVEDPPLKALPYPIEVGAQWVYRREGKPWRIDKKVVAEGEKVKVPAGEFESYKIQWLHDIDQDGEWDPDVQFFDYVSPQGLIKRDILLKDLVWVGPDGPEPIGKFDTRDVSQLTRVNLE
jgi:hypothetical protein